MKRSDRPFYENEADNGVYRKDAVEIMSKTDPSTRTRSCPTSTDDDVVDTRLTGQRKVFKKRQKKRASKRRPVYMNVVTPRVARGLKGRRGSLGESKKERV